MSKGIRKKNDTFSQQFQFIQQMEDKKVFLLSYLFYYRLQKSNLTLARSETISCLYMYIYIFQFHLWFTLVRNPSMQHILPTFLVLACVITIGHARSPVKGDCTKVKCSDCTRSRRVRTMLNHCCALCGKDGGNTRSTTNTGKWTCRVSYVLESNDRWHILGLSVCPPVCLSKYLFQK